jgi:hypothetical protein
MEKNNRDNLEVPLLMYTGAKTFLFLLETSATLCLALFTGFEADIGEEILECGVEFSFGLRMGDASCAIKNSVSAV